MRNISFLWFSENYNPNPLIWFGEDKNQWPDEYSRWRTIAASKWFMFCPEQLSAKIPNKVEIILLIDLRMQCLILMIACFDNVYF